MIREICKSDLIIFCNKIRRMTGVDISHYKDKFLLGKIENFLDKLGKSFVDDREGIISEEEAYQFLKSLSIPTTEFFRDGSMFDLLINKVLPEIKNHKEENKSRILRIWSAGCSTGEETYSLAMVLHEVFGPKLDDFIFSITGTDLNAGSLLKAKKGEFHPKKMEKLPQHLVQMHLDQDDGNKKHLIKNHLRKNVRFQQHDLLKGYFATHFDLILFRNVSIYLSREAQEKILQNLYDSLNTGGFLVIGKTETMPLEMMERFEVVDLGERIYRKL